MLLKNLKLPSKWKKILPKKKSTTDLYSAEKSSQNITNYFLSSQPEILYTNCHIIIAVVDQFWTQSSPSKFRYSLVELSRLRCVCVCVCVCVGGGGRGEEGLIYFKIIRF